MRPAAAAVDAAFLNVPVAYKYPASKAGEADQTAPHLEATRPGFPFLHRLVHALDDGERLSRCVLGCSIASARKLDSLFVCSVLSDHRQILWLMLARMVVPGRRISLFRSNWGYLWGYFF